MANVGFGLVFLLLFSVSWLPRDEQPLKDSFKNLPPPWYSARLQAQSSGCSCNPGVCFPRCACGNGKANVAACGDLYPMVFKSEIRNILNSAFLLERSGV